MSSALFALCFDADDPYRLARFWAGVVGREMVEGTAGLDDLHVAMTGMPVRDTMLEVNGAPGAPSPIRF